MDFGEDFRSKDFSSRHSFQIFNFILIFIRVTFERELKEKERDRENYTHDMIKVPNDE